MMGLASSVGDGPRPGWAARGVEGCKGDACWRGWEKKLAAGEPQAPAAANQEPPPPIAVRFTGPAEQSTAASKLLARSQRLRM
jgi:hypothetical protein